MTRFDAPWDATLRTTTWLVGLLLLAIGLGLGTLGWLAPGPGDRPIVPLLFAPVALLLTVPLAWALAPRGFALEGGAIVVERPLRPVRILLASVRAVELLPPGATRGSLRLLGASGLFGHVGRYWSRALGHYRLYATRSAELVVVDTGGGRFVLSPEPAALFVAAVRRCAPRPTA